MMRMQERNRMVKVAIRSKNHRSQPLGRREKIVVLSAEIARILKRNRDMPALLYALFLPSTGRFPPPYGAASKNMVFFSKKYGIF